MSTAVLSVQESRTLLLKEAVRLPELTASMFIFLRGHRMFRSLMNRKKGEPTGGAGQSTFLLLDQEEQFF